MNHIKRVLSAAVSFCVCSQAWAANPIIPNKGANDPHIRVFNNKAYLSASHDRSIAMKKFAMDDWWLWSSDDLVNWELESVLKPEDTYIGKPFSRCWATDIARRDGKWYWYFSEGNQRAGVMVADSPAGPWTDPLGEPLLDSDLTPTDEYDMGILKDESGEYYIIFGVWDYYIAKLNPDMISLAEAPRRIEINNPRGPYNLDGTSTKKPTDDKPFLHIHKGKYYLSWGCFYAMADNVYGPYEYTDCLLDEDSFAEGYAEPTWPTGFRQGRHGSFFEWNNQWFFAYCDISQTGNRYFRDTFISYVHYKDNGEVARLRVDGVGVGEYDVRAGAIEAENYFAASKLSKKELPGGGFVVAGLGDGDYLTYPSIRGLRDEPTLTLRLRPKKTAVVEVRDGGPKGALLATCQVPSGKETTSISCDLPARSGTQSLCFVVRGEGKDLLDLDSFSFK